MGVSVSGVVRLRWVSALLSVFLVGSALVAPPPAGASEQPGGGPSPAVTAAVSPVNGAAVVGPDVEGRALSVNRVPRAHGPNPATLDVPVTFDELTAVRRPPLPSGTKVVSVPGPGGEARFDGTGVSVLVPPAVGRRGTSVTLRTAPADLARVLSPVGVTFSLSITVNGGPALPGAGRTLPEVGQSPSVNSPGRLGGPGEGGHLGVDDGGPASTWVDSRTGLKVVGPDASLVPSLPVDQMEPPDDSGQATGRGLAVDDTPSGWVVEFSPADLGLDPTSMAELGSRLELVWWSGCDGEGSCGSRRTLPSRFDVERNVMVADIPGQVLAEFAVGGGTDPRAVVAAVRSGLTAAMGANPASGGGYMSVGSSVSGPSGDFSAAGFTLTTGAVSIQTGHAETSYGFDLPPGVGPVPALGLSYSSGSIDGLNTSINTQPGVGGIGWNFSGAQITRQTRICGGNQSGQLCYGNGVGWDDGFSLVMDGAGGRLARTTTTGTATVMGRPRVYTEYKLENDPTIRVRRFQYDTYARDLVALASRPSGDGYWTVNSHGVVKAYGTAVHHGDAPPGVTIRDMEATPSGNGYWLLGADGGVFAYGDAGYFGSIPGIGKSVTDVVSIAAQADGSGYWILRASGSVYAFSAPYQGGIENHVGPNLPGIDIEGHGNDGYWVLRGDGSVYALGSAPFHGNWLSSWARSIVSTASGNGYWTVDRYGHLHAFGPDATLTDDPLSRTSDYVRDMARSGSTSGLFVAQQYGRVVTIDGAPWTEGSASDTRGSFWEVTTGDGNLYYFGLEHEPNTNRWTNSVRFAPVYDPVTQATSTYECYWSMCDTALAWNLDRVEDPSGNVASLFYEPGRNWYQGQVAQGTLRSRGYVRDLILTRVEYGFASGNEASAAPFVAAVGYSARCKETSPGVCEQDANGNAVYPDTPVDLGCWGFTTCSHRSPSFYTYWRLNNLTTRVLNGAGTYDDVKRWRLDFDFFDPDSDPNSDDSVRKLFLTRITAEAAPGNTDPMPPVVFEPVMLANRVNHPAGVSPMTMPRIGRILNELGGITTFNYGQSHPWAQVSACSSAGSNNIRPPCDAFVAYDSYTGSGGFVWWNKWKVMSMTVDPRTGGDPMTTTYTYVDPPNWRYSERFGLTQEDTAQCDPYPTGCNMWTNYRGHSRVDVTTGDGITTRYWFHTGMHEDRNAGNNPAKVVWQINDSSGTPRYDWEQFYGREFDRQVVETATGRVLSRELNLYTRLAPVGASWPNSRQSYRWATYPRVYADDGATFSQTKTTFARDSYRNFTAVYDWGTYNVGGTNGDEFTTRISYAAPGAEYITGRVTSETRYPGISATLPSSGWLSRTEYSYVAGTSLVSQQRIGIAFDDSNGAAPDRWSTTNHTYDSRGRPLSMTDSEGATVSYTYNSTYGYRTSETASLSGTTTFTVDPGLGVVTSMSRNGVTTTVAHDGFGRVTEVWRPGDPTAPQSLPSTRYIYAPHDHQGNFGASWFQPAIVATLTLVNPTGANARYAGSWAFHDGLGRPIQTQTEDPNNSEQRVLTDTRYDAAGRVALRSAPFHDATARAGIGYLARPTTPARGCGPPPCPTPAPSTGRRGTVPCAR